MPPFSGPPLPLSEIVMSVGGTVVAAEESAASDDQRSHERQMDGDRHGQHPLQPRRCLHPVAQDSGDVHQRSLGILATMPMFWTPAAFSASMTFIRS